MHDSSASCALADQRARCLRLNALDNVAVLLADASPGRIAMLGPAVDHDVALTERIIAGHKVALAKIESGGEVVKCGVAIGFATATIQAGAWVHTHNCRSGLDPRSHTLDRHSGAPTDTQYR